jgi:PAS domain S-box-containing protein
MNGIVSKINNPQTLRVLTIDDSEDDVLLVIRELKRGGYNPLYERVETASAMKKALQDKKWDIILCDYKMPNLDGPSAITLLKETNIDIPIIIVSGNIGEDTAIECMHRGAQDYIMKSNLSRLCPAITREIEEAKNRQNKKQVEEQLREEEQRFRALADQSSDIIVSVNRKGIITYENNAVKIILGYRPEERIGASSLDNMHPDDVESNLNAFRKIFKDIHAPVFRAEIRLRHKDESWRIFEEIASGLSKDNKVESIIINLRDITERKQFEEVLKKNELMFRSLFKNSPVGIFLLKDRTFVEVNPALCNIMRYSAEELIGQPVRIGYASDEEYERAGKTLYEQVVQKGLGITEAHLKRKDGEIFNGLLYLSLIDPRNDSLGYEGIMIDITARKHAEEALRKSERYFKEITENSSDIIVISDEKGNIKYCSPAIERFTGYKPEEVIGKSGFYFIHPDEIKRAFDDFDTFIEDNGSSLSSNSFKVVHKDGSERFFYGMGKNMLNNPDIAGVVMNIRDITEQKIAEEALKKSEEKYRNIFENAMEGIYQVTPDGKFITANATFARMAGYNSPEDFMESIHDIKTQLYVHAEDRDKFLEIMQVKNFVKDFEVEFYRKDRSTFWVVLNARMVKDEQGNFLYNEGLVEDITLRKQAEEKLKQSLERLRKAVSTTIQVLVAALEIRDPYTAGHQARCADLACAIATDMGLSQERIDGIRMAGIIHDIGKMSIPVEILSKPTKLTNLEFSLIKEHSHSGFEMLKDVEPSWPLAEIVHQHHERLNGTGYPRNLKGNDILIEARILAVADVVEAMASHRPYRASLGIEAALEEIEKNKGILYDNEVANACLKLFREKGYKLE